MNTNELRKLAKRAIQEWMYSDFYAAASPALVITLSDEIDRLRTEAVAADIRIANDALVIAELTAERDEFMPFLKEGESPIDRLKRERGDVASLMKLYEKSAAERDALRAKLSALEKQEPVGEVDEDDSGLFVDLETPNGTVVKFGQKLYAAAGAAPVPSELVLTFNFGTLVKVVFQDRVLYEVDLSPKPYFQVCWAHGWAGDYDSEEEARNECLSLCGYGRSIREVKPGDDGYKNPRQPKLTERRFLLAAAGAAPKEPT